MLMNLDFLQYMVDLDKYLISQDHCCHKMFNQSIFYFLICEIEINDQM
jgi:hypothetical protein